MVGCGERIVVEPSVERASHLLASRGAGIGPAVSDNLLIAIEEYAMLNNLT